MFEISRSAYYKWIESGRAKWNNYSDEDANIIYSEHFRLEQRYGVKRLKHEIQNKLGKVFSYSKVRRYLRNMGLVSTNRGRKPKYVQDQKKRNHLNMAPNLLNNNFTASRPYQKMSTDVSYIKCTEGNLYLSVVKDLFNNEIIAYSISIKNDINLALDTLRQLPKGDGIIHSDQGSLYFSNEYIDELNDLGYKRSMSRRGACWENSPVENWFSQIKQECLYPLGITDFFETVEAIKKYVQWYNTERIQASLKYVSPLQFKLT